MKVKLPEIFGGQKKSIEVRESQIRKSPITGPLSNPYQFQKDRKIQSFSDARTITRALDISETEQKPDLSLVFEEALIKIFEKYPNTESLPGNEKLLAEEKISGALKYFLELLAIRNFEFSDALKHQITHYCNYYKLPESRKNQIIDIFALLRQNRENLEMFNSSFNGNESIIFFQLFGEKLSSYPGLKITKGPIGYEIRGDTLSINKLYKSKKPAVGFATSKNFNINGQSLEILINVFSENRPYTYNHELQHNLNTLFKHHFQSGAILHPAFLLKKLSTNRENQGKILDEAYGENFKYVLFRFGNELLSQLRGSSTIEDIKTFMQQAASGSKYYDYLDEFTDEKNESLRGVEEYYYRSTNDNKIYPSSKLLTEEECKAGAFEKIEIDKNLNYRAKEKFKGKFVKETNRIIRALEIVLRNNKIDVNSLIEILSLTPINQWEGTLKNFARN
jgi:hypothetical protein